MKKAKNEVDAMHAYFIKQINKTPLGCSPWEFDKILKKAYFLSQKALQRAYTYGYVDCNNRNNGIIR
jgi:hypothetical protein